MKKNNKKIVLLLLVLTISFTILVGCSKKENNNINNEANVEENINNEDIYSNKTEYVGDSSKVVGIVSSLDYSKNYTYNSIEIISEEKPYGLVVYLDENSPSEEKDFFNQAVATFALIENLDNLKYSLMDNKDIIEEFNREDVDLILRENGEKSLAEISQDKSEIDKYIN